MRIVNQLYFSTMIHIRQHHYRLEVNNFDTLRNYMDIYQKKSPKSLTEMYFLCTIMYRNILNCIFARNNECFFI